MNEVVDVNTGEVAVRRGCCILRAMALGSCIAVAAYEAQSGVAGMVHVMLPGPGPQVSPGDLRYAAAGIGALLDQMDTAGCRREAIEVCLVGAGNVLRNEKDTICGDNIRSVTAILRERNIPIRASFLGGYERKSAFVEAETGRIFFTEGSGARRRLWPPDADSENDSVQ